MNSRQRRKRAANIERYPIPEGPSIFRSLGCDWAFMRKVHRVSRQEDDRVPGLWIGPIAARRHHRRYRARMGR